MIPPNLKSWGFLQYIIIIWYKLRIWIADKENNLYTKCVKRGTAYVHTV